MCITNIPLNICIHSLFIFLKRYFPNSVIVITIKLKKVKIIFVTKRDTVIHL